MKDADADGSVVRFYVDNQRVSLHPRGSCCFGSNQEVQEAIQMFKSHVKNYSIWHVEIQMLTYRMGNASSQIEMLKRHLGDANANIQMLKGALKNASALNLQTHMLRSSLEEASAEIQQLKGGLQKTNAFTLQTQDLMKSSSENTSAELHTLSRSLESAHTEIQMLKAGLEMANSQARLANSSLRTAQADILALRGCLDSVNDVKTQDQVLRSSLEGALAEIQSLKESLKNVSDLNAQTENLLKAYVDNTSADIQALRGHVERAGNERHLLKRDLETVSTQTQLVNGRLEQADAQIQALEAELKNVSTLSSQLQGLNGQLENARSEIETLKQGANETSALSSQAQTLGSDLQKANAEIERLKGDLENTKTLTATIQEEQKRLGTQAATASQVELQKQILQLMLQGWKGHRGNLYYFSDVKKSWNDAEKFCVSKGAHLASVTSQEEQSFLVQFTKTSYHWIGLTDKGSQGSWRWVDGTTYNAAQSRGFWEPNQPDNWRHPNGQVEDCVHVRQRWNDMNCSASYQWVCKKTTGWETA
ncbi:C-type lectin domain family 4 member F [Ctenodactylus gundi]